MEQLARIDARIPLSVKETIDFAAALEGRTRTDFLIAAASERARRVISESQVVRLSLRDQKTLADALADNNAREPDAFLEGLAAQYMRDVCSE